MSKSYAEKLKDPRWQRKRLEVLEAANWRCSRCDDASNELQVHHPAYKKGCAPWDYDTDRLVCLCADCHKLAEAGKDILSEMLLLASNATLHTDLAEGRIDEAVYAFAALLANYVDSSGMKVGFCNPKSLEASIMRQTLGAFGLKASNEVAQ